MNSDSNTILRALAVLDMIDKYGRISAKEIEATGTPRSTAYRYLRSLNETGLLARESVNGYYVSGPRYNRQPPGTRFDKKSVQARILERAKTMIRSSDGKKMSVAAAARVLNVPQSTLKNMLRRDAENAGQEVR